MDEEKLIRRIDRSTIKRNPNAGAMSVLVPGCIKNQYDANGNLIGQTRQVTRVDLMTPVPEYDYGYIQLMVTCENCKAMFDSCELESYDDDDNWAPAEKACICPKCGYPECCPEIEEEELTDDMVKESKCLE